MPSQAPVAQTGLHLYASMLKNVKTFDTQTLLDCILQIILAISLQGRGIVVCRDHVGEEHLPHTFCFDNWEYDGCSSLNKDRTWILIISVKNLQTVYKSAKDYLMGLNRFPRSWNPKYRKINWKRRKMDVEKEKASNAGPAWAKILSTNIVIHTTELYIQNLSCTIFHWLPVHTISIVFPLVHARRYLVIDILIHDGPNSF